MPSTVTALDRFYRHVKVLENGCHEWTGFVNKDGYGMFKMPDGRALVAHRAIYELKRGPIDNRLPLDHTCHTTRCPGGATCPHRRCVNDDHLEPVTQIENYKRGHGTERARIAALGSYAAQTHCKHGHEYTPENTARHGKQARRACRICYRLRHRLKSQGYKS